MKRFTVWVDRVCEPYWLVRSTRRPRRVSTSKPTDRDSVDTSPTSLSPPRSRKAVRDSVALGWSVIHAVSDGPRTLDYNPVDIAEVIHPPPLVGRATRKRDRGSLARQQERETLARLTATRSCLLQCMSLLLAQSRHGPVHRTCPLSGVKQT
jgi:hypothetical protein